jgi:hypothetical protein
VIGAHHACRGDQRCGGRRDDETLKPQKSATPPTSSSLALSGIDSIAPRARSIAVVSVSVA